MPPLFGTPPVISYRGLFELEPPPQSVWEAIEHTECFEAWWGWLHELELEGSSLAEGSVLHGVVDPPIPYTLRIDVELTRCEPPHEIDALVRGDLQGPAQLRLWPSSGCTRAEVAWTLEMLQAPMRSAARVARPLLQWGHDRVVEMTVASFRRRLGSGRLTPGGQ